jgi:hypothetical protein
MQLIHIMYQASCRDRVSVKRLFLDFFLLSYLETPQETTHFIGLNKIYTKGQIDSVVSISLDTSNPLQSTTDNRLERADATTVYLAVG